MNHCWQPVLGGSSFFSYRPPSRSALRRALPPLRLAPATTASAAFSLRLSASGFGFAAASQSTHKARSPQVRTHSFAAPTPDLRRLSFDHESFAVSGPLALLGTAFYPALVHRHAASLHASSPRSVALLQLRLASFVVINLREELHLQEGAHAGRTKKYPKVLSLFWHFSN